MSESTNGYYLDYFSGGVPPLSYFEIRVNDVRLLSGQQQKDDEEEGLNFRTELCIIGLAAYFEAFCKDQFAAIVNIAPQTLSRFATMRDCKLPVKSLLHALPDMSHKLGFLIAEEYDFGTAKCINSLFSDLLKLSPFSQAEMERYAKFLNDRNLLVHHGGVYTLKYATQHFSPDEVKSLINMHSLTVQHSDVEDWAEFLLSVAIKTAKASAKALLQFAADNNIVFDNKAKAAINSLNSK